MEIRELIYQKSNLLIAEMGFAGEDMDRSGIAYAMIIEGHSVSIDINMFESVEELNRDVFRKACETCYSLGYEGAQSIMRDALGLGN